MDKDEQTHKKFLEEQLEWCKEQDRILEQLEMKFYEMKRIAEYSLDHDLTLAENEELNFQLTELKREVYLLEEQLHTILH